MDINSLAKQINGTVARELATGMCSAIEKYDADLATRIRAAIGAEAAAAPIENGGGKTGVRVARPTSVPTAAMN